MRIAVVIPCFRVAAHVLGVIARIPPVVERIYVIDDACPEGSGALVGAQCGDPRVQVLQLETNLGVGGATMAGYRAALAGDADIVVKIDGDGQMDPALLPHFVAPIVEGLADYTKGNRFLDLDALAVTPSVRLFGNAVLSFLSKFSTGYWTIFDPTNGYTAIQARVLQRLPLDKISQRYFFESDLLFRLGVMRAVVLDIPMAARYGDETSSLKIGRIVGPFFAGHLRNTLKRIGYQYYLRDFSLASLALPLGLLAIAFGGVFGAWSWIGSIARGIPATSGTVMLAGLPVIVGFQLVLSFFNLDMQNTPRVPLQKVL